MKPRYCLAIVSLLLLAGASGWGQAIGIELTGAQGARERVTVRKIGKLAAGGRQRFSARLGRAESLELRVPFAAAPFNGTQLNATVNGRRLLPYFAFGGDIRYDAVKGKPGMRPPVATIEGRWIISADWLRAGSNEVTLWTTGVTKDAALERLGPKPEIRIASITIGPLDGTEPPVYSNSVYYDFDVWAQGYPWGDTDPNRLRNTLALLGVINGKGMPCVAPTLGGSEASLWATKRACEDNALGWGMGHQEFYTIWEFTEKPQLWADMIDVDNNVETKGVIGGATVYPQRRPPGIDLVMYKPEEYAKTLEPAIRYLSPYTDFYNFKCEQSVARGYGFGQDGNLWKDYGYDANRWARNHYEGNKAAHDLVQKYNPEVGRVEEMHFWGSTLRTILYDTALKRNQPESNLIDILMTHFTGIDASDRDAEGRTTKESSYDRQYPHPAPRATMTYPEIAIDLNRYRLSRTEKDMTLGDPKVNRWGGGQPFDYRAGFRGDEPIYNSENGIWNTGYCGQTPYQFLQGFFSYSLLPTGASEPRDLNIQTRASLTEMKEQTVRRYGEWVEGAGNTKRLRTVDPLYGDMFGWTGMEYCNFGDYISMVGIKEPHHRVAPNDAFGLARRTCYAFVTAGPVIPAEMNPGSSDDLFVKALAQTFNSQTYIGIYAANFSTVPQALDVTLPFAFPAGTQALVFDDRAWDWLASARLLSVPAGDSFRYTTMAPALSAWLVLIPVSPETLAAACDLPAAPAQLSLPDMSVEEGLPAFNWKAADPRASYTVEVGREAIFRPRDRVELAEGVTGTSYTMKAAPAERWRYFWRVAAVDEQGKRGPWSAPRAFVYRWPEYAAVFPAKEAAAPSPLWPTPAGRLLDDEGDLTWQGDIFGTGGNMNSPTRAIDRQDSTFWTNGTDEGNAQHQLPAEWCVIWPQTTTLRSVKIEWKQDMLPGEFTLQVSDDAKVWRQLLKLSDNIGVVTELILPQPVTARYFRINIPSAKNENGGVGIREVFLR